MRLSVSLTVLLTLAAATPSLLAETYRLTMAQAVDRAISQNPQVVMAKLDERKVAESVGTAKDPFTPKLIVGSGLAYTNGFPLSVEGSAPSIIQVVAKQAILNRPLTYKLAESRESARGAQFSTAIQRDEIAFQTASLYLDIVALQRSVRTLADEIGPLERVVAVVTERVTAGRELPIEQRKAELSLARVQRNLAQLRASQVTLSAQLASLCGMTAEDTVEVIETSGQVAYDPVPEEQAIDEAIRNSKDVRRLQSAMLAKGFAVKAAKSARLPQVDLISQYALLGRYNNYDRFFASFERHNYQFGATFKLPVFAGAAAHADAAVADIDIERLRAEMNDTRNRITLNVRKSLSDFKVAEDARNFARLDLDVARDSTSVLLAQQEEGRIPLTQLEESRTIESERWLTFFQAQTDVEKAKLRILRQTGLLTTVLR